METTRLCPECQTPLPADAPAGLCPRCLLQQGALRDSASAPTEPPRRHKGPPSAPALAAVAARFPQFEVRQLIGVGGMGAVYEVRQPQLDRIVALKVMLPEVADDPKFAERFTREARALAKLNHPNIVAVYDFGQAGDWFYFVMEFVDGANLRQTMRAGRLTAAQALAIVPKLCDALQFAHDEGIMHRDIKPENILLDKKGRVKIADFGLAKLLGSEPDDPSITVTGVGMGTPRYMAPEQIENAKSVDHRADIYSLGVVFYEMLTGELPLGRFATPSEKVQIDVRLDEIVLRSLERDVARRYQHVSEVKTAVENVTSTPGAKAPATPPAASPVPPLPINKVKGDGTAPPRENTPGATSVETPLRTFLRLLLWLVVIAGAVVFCWFEKVTYLDRNHPIKSELRVGAVQPWLVVTDRGYDSAGLALRGIKPDFATWSALGGLCALVAGAALFSTRRRSGPDVRSEVRRCAIGLFVVGAINAVMVIGFWLMWFPESSWTQHPVICWLVQAGFLFFAALTFLIFRGALQMLHHESLAASRCGAICSVLSLNLVSIPVGIWALVRLSRPEVQALFSRQLSDSPAPAPGINAGADSREPRLSRHALWGAVWAGGGLFALVLLAVGFFSIHQPHQRLDEMRISPLLTFLAVSLVAVTSSALIGTTILAAIARAQIKRSGGRLYGLRLATAELFFIPLFLLAVVGVRVLISPSPAQVIGLAGVLFGLFMAWRAATRANATAAASESESEAEDNPAAATTPAPASPVAPPPSAPPAPVDHLNNFLGFIMTPQPGYARQVGIPMLTLTGVWLVVMLAVTFLVPQENESVHVITMSVGLLGIPLGLLFLSLRWAVRRGESPEQASHRGRSFLGLPAWLWPVSAAVLVVAAVFVPKPGDLKEPQDMAKIFHPTTLITPEGGSYRFLALDEAKKFTPVYAVTWSSVANQSVTRTFGGGTGGVNLGFYRRHARWSYQLATHRFGDWKSAADGPIELTPAERVKLRPLVVSELNRRELRRGARLEQLLDHPVEIASVVCWQNGVVLLAWLALALAGIALVRWLWCARAGRIVLISLAGMALLALLLLWQRAGRPGPTDTAAREKVSRAADAVPSLGTITNGIGAQFTVPAGQVAVFELVTRSNRATVAIPNFAAYVIAPVAQAHAGTFRLSREPEEIVAGVRRRPWRIEVLTSGGGRVSSAGLELPPALDSEVGGMAIGLLLAANQETVEWQTTDTNNLPATGLIGLRVRTLTHGIAAGDPRSAGASAAASTNWSRGMNGARRE